MAGLHRYTDNWASHQLDKMERLATNLIQGLGPNAMFYVLHQKMTTLEI